MDDEPSGAPQGDGSFRDDHGGTSATTSNLAGRQMFRGAAFAAQCPTRKAALPDLETAARDREPNSQAFRIPLARNRAAELSLDSGSRQQAAESLALGFSLDGRPASFGPCQSDIIAVFRAHDVNGAVRRR